MSFFEALWNNRYIDNIQITVAETVGVGSRASYYDQYGAIRDMLQNHLLQLICLVAMEPPARVLTLTKFAMKNCGCCKLCVRLIMDQVVLGQYHDYAHEVGKPTLTETYVGLKVLIDNWRWAGVPFYIRTGEKTGDTSF